MPAEPSLEAVPATKPRIGFLGRSLATASTRLLDLPTRYGLHLIVAARLSIADVGAFYIVFSVMTMASGFGRLGVDRAVTREVAVALGSDLPNTARRAVRRGFVATLTNSGVLALGLALLAKPIAVYILHKPGLALPLAIGAISILPQNIANAAAGALAGLGRVGTSQMIYQWLWPGLFCISALAVPLDITRTLMLIIGCLTVDAIVGIALLWRVLPERHPETHAVPEPGLYKLGIQLFSLEILQLAISSAPPFVLGMVATTVAVGRYALAWRIVLMLNLLVSAMGAIASPQFARASASGDKASLRRVAAQSVGLAVGLSALPALLLAINPVFFLSRFGAAYAPAAPVLRILLLGQIALTLCTAVPELLGMTGHAKSLFRINVASLAVLVGGLAVLTPRFGDVGAAGACAAAMVASACAASYIAKRDLGLVPIVNFLDDARAKLRSSLRPAVPADRPDAADIVDADQT